MNCMLESKKTIKYISVYIMLIQVGFQRVVVLANASDANFSLLAPGVWPLLCLIEKLTSVSYGSHCSMVT